MPQKQIASGFETRPFTNKTNKKIFWSYERSFSGAYDWAINNQWALPPPWRPKPQCHLCLYIWCFLQCEFICWRVIRFFYGKPFRFWRCILSCIKRLPQHLAAANMMVIPHTDKKNRFCTTLRLRVWLKNNWELQTAPILLPLVSMAYNLADNMEASVW